MSLLAAPTVTAQGGGWQVHEGPAARHSFGRTIANGDNEGFLSGAQIPSADDSGWSSASSDGSLRWSGPGGTPCRAQANYTYFQTIVRPEPGANYEIDFINVDDAARISTVVGTGTMNIPETIGLREAKTVDITPFLDANVDNRVVITLADVCGAGNGISAKVRMVPGATASADDEMPSPAFSGYYRLKTQDRGDNECLESNAADSDYHGGNAFMDACQDVSGQLWSLVDAGNGYYRLKSMYRGDNECLESNAADSGYHGGNAFMDACQDVSGQLWSPVDAGEGRYHLKSMYRGEGECLEGNGATSDVHGGNSFMMACRNATGQRWAIVPVR
jgi:hypothetical protein